MTFEMFGAPIDLFAVFVFIVATLIFTELVKACVQTKTFEKPYWEKFFKTSNLFPLFTSWLIGWGIFLILKLIWKEAITLSTVFQFLFFTTLLNGGYALLKPVIKVWLEKFRRG